MRILTITFILFALLHTTLTSASFFSMREFDENGGSYTAQVFSEGPYTVTLPDFIQGDNPLTGNGPTDLDLTVSPYTLKGTRGGYVMFEPYRVPQYVYQRGPQALTPIRSDVSGSTSFSRYIPPNVEPISQIMLSHPRAVGLYSHSSWLNFKNEYDSQADQYVLSVEPEPNTSNSFRYSHIYDSIEGYSFTMIQPSPHQVSFDQTPIDIYDFATTNTIYQISVTADEDVEYPVYCTAPWARVLGEPIRKGSQIIEIEVLKPENPGDSNFLTPNNQFQKIYINNQVVDISLVLIPIEGWCTFLIDEVNITSRLGGHYVVGSDNKYDEKYQGEPDCYPHATASTIDNWITILDSSSIHVEYSVEPNDTGLSRTGHIFLGNAMHSVIQTAEGEQDHWLVD